MAIEFKIEAHSILPGTEVVHILVNGETAGVIYPMGDDGIKLVSAHMIESSADDQFAGEVVIDSEPTTWPPIPAIYARFKPSMYSIEGDHIVRHDSAKGQL